MQKPNTKLLVSTSSKAFKGSFDRDTSKIPRVRKSHCYNYCKTQEAALVDAESSPGTEEAEQEGAGGQ